MNLINKKKYNKGDVLLEDEYLLRVNDGVGFLSKLNKDGSISKNFIKWNRPKNWVVDRTKKPYGGYYKETEVEDLGIVIHKEDFSSGWEFIGFRGGVSQDWAILKHPEGFQLEVYIDTLIDMIGSINIKKGVLQGKFKWSYSKLIKKT